MPKVITRKTKFIVGLNSLILFIREGVAGNQKDIGHLICALENEERVAFLVSKFHHNDSGLSALVLAGIKEARCKQYAEQILSLVLKNNLPSFGDQVTFPITNLRPLQRLVASEIWTKFYNLEFKGKENIMKYCPFITDNLPAIGTLIDVVISDTAEHWSCPACESPICDYYFEGVTKKNSKGDPEEVKLKCDLCNSEVIVSTSEVDFSRV